MFKYKSIGSGIKSKIKVSKIFQSIKSRKIIALVLLILVLAILVVIVAINRSNKNGKVDQQQSSTPNYGELSYAFTREACAKDIEKLSQYDTSASSEDSAKILNYKGQCYLSTKEYDKARNVFEQMKPLCAKLSDLEAKRCNSLAENGIASAKTGAGQSVNSQQKQSKDVSPELQKEILASPEDEQ